MLTLNKPGKVRNRVVTIALSAMLAAGCVCTGSMAAEAAGNGQGISMQEGQAEFVTLSQDGETDYDALFAEYAEGIFYSSQEISLYSSDYAVNVLNDTEYRIYSELKSAITDIAAGNTTSSVVTISEDIIGSGGLLAWSYEDLGLNAPSTQEELNSMYNDIMSASKEMFESTVDTELIFECLLEDCPYELYWFDKTSMTVQYSRWWNGNSCWISAMTFTFKVAESYQDGNSTTVDSTKVSAANEAAENAKQIVKSHASESDTDKLEAYKNEICGLVTYDQDTADLVSYTYGDPWQLIYVFDGDPDTNVVCEGYTKAFQYLCELSDFENTACYTVMGTLYLNGEPDDDHAWNIVSINGENYLADVTNSDDGQVGENGELFLVSAADASEFTTGESYAFEIGDDKYTYEYDDDTKTLFTADILALSTEGGLSENSNSIDNITGSNEGSGTSADSGSNTSSGNSGADSSALGTTSGAGNNNSSTGDSESNSSSNGTSISGSTSSGSDSTTFASTSVDSLCVRRGNAYYFSYTIHAGNADKVVYYGKANDEVLIGDWDGDGIDTICVRRGNAYYFKNDFSGGNADTVVYYGKATDEVLVGDWDGDGKDTLAVRRGNAYYISNSVKSGNADKIVYYGKATDTVLAGDWDGDGKDTLAVRRGNAYYISNTIKSGNADKTVYYGKATDIVLVGDWDGDGDDTLAVRRGNIYYISNTIKSGNADKSVPYGKVTDEVYAGTWK